MTPPETPTRLTPEQETIELPEHATPERLRELVSFWRERAKGQQREIDALRADAATLRQQLEHWQTCENCGEKLRGPGICDKAVSESEKGWQLMWEETIARAERAEADAATLRRERDEARNALGDVAEDVCGLLCPSVWKTAEGRPPHHAKCQAITAALASPDAARQEG